MKKQYARHHDDIKRLLAQIRREAAHAGTTHPNTQAGTAAVLDALGALGSLEQIVRRPPGRVQCFGPRSLHGNDDHRCWTAVVLWHRLAGFASHRQLDLLGVWAVTDAEDGSIHVIAGTQRLTYTGQPYNREAYFHALRRDFTPYYGKQVPPSPPETTLYAGVYDPSGRIAQRRALDAALHHWHNELDAAGRAVRS